MITKKDIKDVSIKINNEQNRNSIEDIITDWVKQHDCYKQPKVTWQWLWKSEQEIEWKGVTTYMTEEIFKLHQKDHQKYVFERIESSRREE